MLEREDIVCLAHEPWHGPWKTYQQIMSLLADVNRVLYVGPPASLREALTEMVSRTKRRPALEQISRNLIVYHEPWILARANGIRPGAQQWNRTTARLRLAHVRVLARRRGFTAPILWVFDPMMAPAVGTFGEKLVVYHVLDNYMEFVHGFTNPRTTALRAALARNEDRIMRRADLVFAVSERLRGRCLRSNPNSFLVPNGVNYEMFQARRATGQVPADVASIPRPIIGSVGAIQPDLDLPLLRRISIERPQWSLVLVGPEELGAGRPELDALLSRPNVHYLGCKPVEDVPAYIAACDVCIMPYRPAEATVVDGDSIKLYEYLACGRPVVSVDVPSVRRFLPLVRIGNTPATFIRCIEKGLAEDPGMSERRRTLASEHSWQRRVAMLSQLIAPRLSARSCADRGPTARVPGGMSR